MHDATTLAKSNLYVDTQHTLLWIVKTQPHHMNCMIKLVKMKSLKCNTNVGPFRS